MNLSSHSSDLNAPSQRSLHALAWLIDHVIFVLQCLCLPLAPLTAALIERSTRHLRFYSDSLVKSAHHINAMRRAQVVSRNLLRTRSDVIRSRVTGECTHCGRCCLHNTCVFLKMQDDGQSRCAIYGTRFFKMLSCGEYPMTAEDIVVYDCPSFESQAVSLTVNSLNSMNSSVAQSSGRRYIRIAQER
jgi:hypothetical protein